MMQTREEFRSRPVGEPQVTAGSGENRFAGLIGNDIAQSAVEKQTHTKKYPASPRSNPTQWMQSRARFQFQLAKAFSAALLRSRQQIPENPKRFTGYLVDKRDGSVHASTPVGDSSTEKPTDGIPMRWRQGPLENHA